MEDDGRIIPKMKAIETTGVHRERYGFKKSLAFLQEYVTVEEYLRAHGVEVKRNRAKCLIHGGDNPYSFSITPDGQRWHCFSCGEHGDLLDLSMRHEGWPEDQYGPALSALAEKFGVEIPTRSERWHDRQETKAGVRNAARNHIAKVYQRRLTRVYAPLVLVGGETEEEEREALEGLAGALWPTSFDLAHRRVNG